MKRRGNPNPSGAAVNDAGQRGTPTVSFGTAYYPDHWPEDQWARDLDRIVAAGLRSVRFGEFSWSWYEPEPGRYAFAAFDRFVDLVEERGLELCLCTPTATPPPWFDTLYPDGRLLDMHGRRCLSHRHFWCWNHERSWRHAARTITGLARRYRDRPCLWGWQIDNEPNYAEQIRLPEPESMYDWNPASRRQFAAWLEQRYETIDRLNRTWWTNFWSQRVRDWNEAATPRGRTNPHAWLDFMRWREASIAGHIGRQAALLRALTPGKRIGCNIPETGVPLSLNIGQDYWRQAAAGLDWVGTDLYQATGDRRRDLERLACSTDLMRSAAAAAKAEFIISETQAGPHVRGWPQPFAGEGFHSDYLLKSADAYVARGATRVWWFLWRPTLGGMEIGMNGLQALNGRGTRRTRAVTAIARTPAEAFAARRRRWLRRPIALIHYSRDSLRFRTAFTADLASIGDSLEGWHAILEHAGYRVEFVDDRGLATARVGSPPLILPHTVVVDDGRLLAIARHPGRLWCGPLTGLCDENGHLRTVLPKSLQLRTRLSLGAYRDTNVRLRWRGIGGVNAVRDLSPAVGARVLARFTGGAPALVEGERCVWCATDVGVLAGGMLPRGRSHLSRALEL
jgi:beta-galactosidase